MIRTYIRLAIRSLFKNTAFSLINIFGLAIGLTCCLLISLYIINEWRYDVQHEKGDRLFQMATLSKIEGREKRFATTPAPMGGAMQAEFPEIEGATRLMKAFEDDKTLLQYRKGSEVRSFYETAGFLADSNFFQLFTYNFIEGHAATALNRPNSVVISEEIARKIFGNAPALNQTIHINSTTNGAHDFIVSGVFRPSTTPSHIDARFFMAMQGGEVGPWIRQLTDMANNNLFYTYLLLKKGASPKGLEAKFPAFIDKHAGAMLKAAGRSRSQFLIPVRDIHLHAGTEGNVTPGGNPKYLYILLSIAVVTLLIACVNFMNLSTARSSKRAVEIGVRKVLGAERRSLVRQFLAEAILLALVAFVCSILFAALLMPLFEQVSGRSLLFSGQQYALLFGLFLVVTIVAGLVAGLYPAFYLSAFKPVKVLKGRFSNSLSAISFRKVLVVFQFVISVGLIVASLTIGNQMRYLRNKDLGFQKEQQVIIPLRTSHAKAAYPSLKNALQSQSTIGATGASIYYPGIMNVTDWLLYKQGDAPDQTKHVYINRVDHSYLQTLGIRAVAGRLFSTQFPGDTSNRIIINEEAVRSFGFASTDAAIGKNIMASWGGEEVPFQVVGVVNDFHFQDLHNPIEAYGFILNAQPYFNYMIAQVKGGDVAGALSGIETAWKRLNRDEPFEYSFLDDDFAKNYIAEDRLAAMIRYFTMIAIFISCLGLFGLTTFTVEQRTKEIGIRKVLGASEAGIVSLLSKDFLKLVFVAFVVAAPLAWYFVQNWLQGFAYRAPFTPWIIAGACAIALLIAFLTISIQAIKAALSNPVKNLRTE